MGVLMVEQNAKPSLAIAGCACLMENRRAAVDVREAPAIQAAYLGGAGR